MKQSTAFSRILLLGLALMLILVACEKPTPGAEEQEKNAQATQEAIDSGVGEPVPTVAPPMATTVPEVMPPATVPSEEAATAVPDETQPAVNPTSAPGDTAPTPDPNVGGNNPSTTATPAPAGGTYTVSAGENFFRIGLNHSCTVEQMAAVNPSVVPPNYVIYVGQTLVIPSCN